MAIPVVRFRVGNALVLTPNVKLTGPLRRAGFGLGF